MKAGITSPHALREIVKHLAINPFLIIKKVAEDLNISFTTAQRAVSKLESLGIVTEITKSRRDRIYCATKILDILEEPLNLNEDFPV